MENRLIKITYPGSNNFSSFTFDPYGRNAKIVETVAGSVTDTRQFVWCEIERCEERDGSGNLTKSFYDEGQANSGTSYFYSGDHLGSLRELTNSTGAVQAEYSFDAFGRVTNLGGSLTADFQYAGYLNHDRSGLSLTLYRQYSPQNGRWLSREPLGNGLNLFQYGDNDPVAFVDSLGLEVLSASKIMAMLKAGDNKSKYLSNEFFLCQMYRESTFDTDGVSNKAAVGLMGVREIATKQVGSHFSEMKIAAKNIRAGTRYVDWSIEHKGGDISKGVTRENIAKAITFYSGGMSGYYKDVANCESCLLNKVKEKCDDIQECLDMAKGIYKKKKK